jgi:hypothetical protein
MPNKPPSNTRFMSKQLGEVACAASFFSAIKWQMRIGSFQLPSRVTLC